MAKKKNKKIIFIGVVVLLVVLIAIKILAGIRGGGNGLAVDTMTLERGNILVTVPANGVLEEVEKQTIYAENSAKVLSIQVEEGDYVEAGQVLALLDGEDLEIQLAIKKQLLHINKLDLEKLDKERVRQDHQLEHRSAILEDAKEDLERARTLYEHGAISQQEDRIKERAHEEAIRAYREAELGQESLQIDIEKMMKNIAIAELEIADIEKRIEKQEGKIVSSINGVVTAIHVEEGSFVNTTNPSFVISNMEDLSIGINVSEYDIGKVEIGQEVEIETDAVKGRIFKGVVDKIAPVAKSMTSGQTNETVVAVEIKVEERDALLKPGFSVKTRIISQEEEDVLKIPFDAIITESNGAKVVFTVKDNLLHKVEVKTGIESDFDVEILEGLEEGDVFIITPSLTMQEGSKLIINDDK